jgi:hypothetical protein
MTPVEYLQIPMKDVVSVVLMIATAIGLALTIWAAGEAPPKKPKKKPEPK